MFTYAFSLSISKTKDDLKFQTSTRSWKIFKEPELPGPWKVPTAGLSSHTAVWAPGARGFSLATASLSLQEWLLPQHLCWALEPRLQPSPRWQVLPSKHPHFLVAHCSHHCQPSQPTPCPSCWPGSGVRPRRGQEGWPHPHSRQRPAHPSFSGKGFGCAEVGSVLFRKVTVSWWSWLQLLVIQNLKCHPYTHLPSASLLSFLYFSLFIFYTFGGCFFFFFLLFILDWCRVD